MAADLRRQRIGMMFINGSRSTDPVRAVAALGTARTDCLRLFHGQAKTSGGNAGNAGNLQSLGNGPLFDDGGKRRKPAEIGGNSVQGSLLPYRTSPRSAVGDWQNTCGNCGNSRDASRQGFMSARGNRQVGNRLVVAEIAEIGRVCDPVRPRPGCLTGVGAAPILPHRKNGLKSRK
jgi:hypothetical protein